MENFMLWSVVTTSAPPSLSFFATRVQLPGINLGTRELIDRMLTDLTLLPGIEYDKWSIRRFMNNYYAAAEDKISSPEAWSETWEISLQLTKPVPPDLVLPNDEQEICRTFARDDTWDDTLPFSALPYIIIARFYHQNLFTKALLLFAEIREPLGIHDPDVPDLVDAIKQHPLSGYVSAWQRSAQPMELAVELGAYDETSFAAKGAQLAEKVSALIYELGATITWDEKTDYLLEQQRYSRSPE